MVISEVKKRFVVKSEDRGRFKYLDLQITQSFGVISIDQEEFSKSLEYISLSNKYDPNSNMSEMQVTQCRSAIGQLNWMATQTRPDLSYDVSLLSSELRNRRLETIKLVNKAIKKAKRSPSVIRVSSLVRLENSRLVVLCDASFANLVDGGSQGGLIVFWLGDKSHSPIYWQSRRVRRLVKSTQAAETLAMVDATEAAIFYRKFLVDMLDMKDDTTHLGITCKTDNKGSYNAVHTTTQILDKRLRIENKILRELLERQEVASIQWVPTEFQTADSLTKSGVPSVKILEHLHAPESLLN